MFGGSGMTIFLIFFLSFFFSCLLYLGGAAIGDPRSSRKIEPRRARPLLTATNKAEQGNRGALMLSLGAYYVSKGIGYIIFFSLSQRSRQQKATTLIESQRKEISLSYIPL